MIAFIFGTFVGFVLCAIVASNRKYTDEDVKFFIEQAIESNNRN